MDFLDNWETRCGIAGRVGDEGPAPGDEAWGKLELLLEGVEGLDLIPLMPFELRGENVYDVLSSSDTPLEGGGRCLSLRKKRAAVVVFGLVI